MAPEPGPRPARSGGGATGAAAGGEGPPPPPHKQRREPRQSAEQGAGPGGTSTEPGERDAPNAPGGTAHAPNSTEKQKSSFV